MSVLSRAAPESGRYFGVQFHLEDALGCRVDMATEKAMRLELRP